MKVCDTIAAHYLHNKKHCGGKKKRHNSVNATLLSAHWQTEEVHRVARLNQYVILTTVQQLQLQLFNSLNSSLQMMTLYSGSSTSVDINRV